MDQLNVKNISLDLRGFLKIDTIIIDLDPKWLTACIHCKCGSLIMYFNLIESRYSLYECGCRI